MSCQTLSNIPVSNQTSIYENSASLCVEEQKLRLRNIALKEFKS